MKEQSIHAGHRQRLRERFLQEGFDGWQQHQILELLLCYALPRKDVNDLAHTLIRRFGSLAGVFEAFAQELMQVDGISENTAVLLTMIPALSKKYSQSRWGNKPKLNSAQISAEFASTFFIGKVYEAFFVFCLDSQCNLIHAVKISEGTLDESPVYIRNVVEIALRHKAHSVIIAHNHPGGSVKPSLSDIRSTKLLYDALKLVGISLHDHIIVSGDNTYNFSRNGLLNNSYLLNDSRLVAEKE